MMRSKFSGEEIFGILRSGGPKVRKGRLVRHQPEAIVALGGDSPVRSRADRLSERTLWRRSGGAMGRRHPDVMGAGERTEVGDLLNFDSTS